MKLYLKTIGCCLVFAALIAGCNHEVTMRQVDQMVRPKQDRRYVSVNALNLRACPTTNCRIIRVLREGDSGLVLQEKSGWAEMLIDRSDAQGWVAAKYLSTQLVEKPVTKPLEPEKKKVQPAMPEEELSQPARSVPPQLQEELADTPPGSTPQIRPEISEELAE